MRRHLARLGTLAAATTALVLSSAASASATQDAYVADYGTGKIGVARVTSAGGLGAPISPSVTTGSPNEGVALTPSGNALFTGDGTNLVDFLRNRVTGALATPTSRPTSSGHGIAVTPNGNAVYQVIDGGGIYGFEVIGDGTTAAALPGSPYATTNAPAGIAITPDGKFLYTANQSNSTVGAFSINANGSLTELPGSPYPSANAPYAISMTPDGKHLYVPARGGSAPQKIFAYDIGATGALTTTPGSPFNMDAAAANSYGSTVTADGKFFFTANFASASISGFAINAQGGLAQLSGSPYALAGAQPSAVTSDATGSHIYVANDAANTAYAFSLSATGVPTAVTGSPFPIDAAGDFQSIALSPAQPPKADLTSMRSGKAVTFSALGSTDDDGIKNYTFDFGDGASQTTTAGRPTHTYKRPGTYTATVIANDFDNCNTTYVSAGQTAYCNGGPGAKASIDLTIPQSQSGGKPNLKVDFKKKGKLGKPITLKLSAQTGVRVTSNHPKVKLKGGPKKSVTYKAKSVNIGEKGKAKLKLTIGKRGARIAKAAKSGKVKINLTAQNNNGRDTESVKIKLK